jgi:hypothetical protein
VIVLELNLGIDRTTAASPSDRRKYLHDRTKIMAYFCIVGADYTEASDSSSDHCVSDTQASFLGGSDPLINT